MNAMRILVAEDDPHIREGLRDTLAGEGYEVSAAANGLEALKLYQQARPQLILLDLMMPGKSGYEVCREIRRTDAHTPVLMLTAKGEEIDKVVGLELGADDYVVKPFGVRELLARVSALLRRSRPAPAAISDAPPLPDRFQFGAGEVEPKKLSVQRGRKQIPISPRELQLITQFRAHPGEVLSRDQLLNAAWGIDYTGTTRTLDQHIAQLRKKIEPNPQVPTVIQTVHGAGYRYQPGG